MIWQNPWAWVGLVTIALPVLIHLLGRGHARVSPFPTLRFVTASRLLPTRRTRIHDWLLLIVRVGIIASAVAALAQPLFLTSQRKRSAGAITSRVIIVDTSASMRRLSRSVGPAVEVARHEAQRIVRESQSMAIVAETAEPARAIPGAVEWLDRQPGRREIVIVSDFQTGAIDSVDLSGVPAGVGIRLAAIGVNVPQGPTEILAREGDAELMARARPSERGTDVEWISSAPIGQMAPDNPVILAGAAERSRADAAMRAARSVAVQLPLDSTRPIAIVFPGYERRAELLRTASASLAPWMTDAAERLADDSLLIGASTGAVGGDSVGRSGLVVLRSAGGRPLVVAAADSATPGRLLLFAATEPGSVASAALIVATNRVLSLAGRPAELDPSVLSDATVTSWQRPSADASAARRDADGNTGPSDGRWFWVLALLLIGLETVLRRTRPATQTTEAAYDKAA